MSSDHHFDDNMGSNRYHTVDRHAINDVLKNLNVRHNLLINLKF